MSVDREPVAPDAPDFIAALGAEQFPTDDLTESGRSFFRFKRDGAVAGFGGIWIVNRSKDWYERGAAVTATKEAERTA